MIHNINISSNSFFASLLLSLIPLSFILGNLAINLNILIIVLFCIFLLIKERNKNKIQLILFDKLIIIFFLYIFIISAFNYFVITDDIHKSQLIIKTFSFLRYLLLYFSLRFLMDNKYLDLKYFFLISSFSVLFVSLDVIIQYSFGQNLFGYEGVSRRMSGPFGDELIAGSYIARFSLFLIFSFFIFKFFKNMTFKNKFFIFSIVSLVLSLGMILAGNRVPFLIFLFIVLLSLIIMKKHRIYFFSFLIISLSCISILKNYDEEILKHYGGFQTQIIYFLKPLAEENKIQFENKNKLTSDEKNYSFSFKGESYITKSVHAKEFYTGYKTWLQNKFFGGGLKSFRFNCPKVFVNCNAHPHNYYLEILSDLGVIGLLIIISFFFFVLKESYCKKKIIILPFLLILFGELFPLKTTGSFFGTANSTFIFLQISLIISILNRKDLN